MAIEPETYFAERKALIDAEVDQARTYDRAILTLAGGALALSLTFIRQLPSCCDFHQLEWLIGGWTGFIVSLLATLTSLQASQMALRRQRTILDEMHTSESTDHEEKNWPSKITHWLNIGSIASFILGTAFLATFVGLNLRS